MQVRAKDGTIFDSRDIIAMATHEGFCFHGAKWRCGHEVIVLTDTGCHGVGFFQKESDDRKCLRVLEKEVNETDIVDRCISARTTAHSSRRGNRPS